jgi:phage-related minor tail protein
VLESAHGSYEAVGDQPAQPKGEPLPSLTDAQERVLDWARTLAAHLQQDGAHTRFPWATAMRDDFVLIAAALEHHADQADETAELRAHAATLEADLETERQRVERLQTQLKEAREGASVLKAAIEIEHKMRAQLSAENEEQRSELGALRVEAEATRVAIDGATQAILDAGVELTAARAEAHLLGQKMAEAAETIDKLNRALLERMSARGVA